MRLSIIVPTHNRADILARTLSCVERQEVPLGVDAELFVVANNCTDNTVEVSQQAIERIAFPGRVVEEFEPGLCAARNRGVRESAGDFCLMIDDDVGFDSGWLSEIAEFFGRTGADVAGGRVTLWWEAVERPEWFTRSLDSLLSIADLGDRDVEIHNHVGIVGANMWFRRRVWEDIGAFRPDLDRCGAATLGGGDSEFIERALRAGYRAFYTPSGALRHWVAPGRIEKDYLVRVATGNARGRVRMKPPLSAARWTRAFVGHAWLWGSNAVKAKATRLAHGDAAAVDALTKSGVGWGGLQGLWDRLQQSGAD